MNKNENKLVSVKPGKYMLVEKNEMKRIALETQGLLVGKRVKNDNHYVVLVDNQLILIPSSEKIV